MNNIGKRLLFTLVLTNIVAGLTATAAHAAPPAQVVSPNKKVLGLSYGEWSAQWWQYVMGVRKQDNPLNDPTGENCAVDQEGQVFFLVGTTETGPVVRACTVLPNTYILFPVVNLACMIPIDGDTLDAIITTCDDIIDEVDLDTLSVTIDGVPVKNLDSFRFQSPAFSFTGANPPVYKGYSGFFETAVSDGYWVMLKPLPPGEHEIHFHAEIPAFNFTVDVTYDLTVPAQ